VTISGAGALRGGGGAWRRSKAAVPTDREAIDQGRVDAVPFNLLRQNRDSYR